MERGKAAEEKREEEKQKKMLKILNEMKGKMGEIEKLRKELEKPAGKRITAEQNKAILEEIEVPALEIIKEKKKKH